MSRPSMYCIFCDGECLCASKKKRNAKAKPQKPKLNVDIVEAENDEVSQEVEIDKALYSDSPASSAKKNAFAAMKSAAKKSKDAREKRAAPVRTRKKASETSFADAVRMLAPLLHQSEKLKWKDILEQDVDDLEERRSEWVLQMFNRN